MAGLEIGLLVVGVFAFALGAVIPVPKGKERELGKDISREEMKEMIAGELADAKSRMGELAEETTGYAVEKAERAMERLTNEKITAVTEYAETVLGDINKSHQEVMFLYNMLNEKHDSFLESVKKADRMITETKETKVAKAAEEGISGMERLKRQTETARKTALQEAEAPKQAKTAKRTSKKAEPDGKKTVKAGTKSTAKEFLAEPEEFPIQFTDSAEEGGMRNNNEKILSLYKMGKSNMAIARELGLGVGEVKLVIDLFKGMSS